MDDEGRKISEKVIQIFHAVTTNSQLVKNVSIPPYVWEKSKNQFKPITSQEQCRKLNLQLSLQTIHTIIRPMWVKELKCETIQVIIIINY